MVVQGHVASLYPSICRNLVVNNTLPMMWLILRPLKERFLPLLASLGYKPKVMSWRYITENQEEPLKTISSAGEASDNRCKCKCGAAGTVITCCGLMRYSWTLPEKPSLL